MRTQIGCLVALLMAAAGTPVAAQPARSAPPAIAEPNPNLVTAGRMEGGRLSVALELRMARWYPDGNDGQPLLLPVFAEAGQPGVVPGPMLRMPVGTQVTVTVRNQLRTKARVFGLHERPSDKPVEFDLAPGATREVSFVAGAAGTYHYYAITDPAATKMTDGPSGRWYEDGALSGAFIVDDQASAAVPDRVWVINIVSLRESPIMQEHEILTINGRAWPHTERISAREGVPVRWRVVNSTPSEHPMHLHGAYFTVLGVGNAERYSARSPAERRTVVTEFMPPEGTYDMEWTPRAAGNWLFHCHYMLHMVADLAVPRIVKAAAHGHATPAVQQSVPAPDAHGMGGLVLAVTVEPRANAAGKAEPPRRRARQLELVLEQGPAAAGAIMTTLREPATGATSASSPGPVLLLRRDEPVDITVVNRLNEATSIHWHGLELESLFDGVPGIGGGSGQVTPAIPPDESFVARMTPPRSGTFIYHTHWAHETQLTSGLYGPLLVLEPGARFNPEREKILVVGTGEVWWTTREVLLNGSRSPPPLELQRGRTYLLRLINIAPNQDITVTLGAADGELEWRAVAKDGFTLPPSQRTVGKARLVFSVGETYDFEFTPGKAGTYQLRVRTNFSDHPTAEAVAMVHVR